MYLSERIKLRSTNVNLIKFLCTLLVIFSHSFAVARNVDDPLAVWTNGKCNFGGVAVAVFFFYSGLYVAKSLSKETSALTFIWKRCKRIFPQLWIVVGITVFIVGPILTISTKKYYFLSSDTYKYLLNGLLLPIHNLPGVFANNYYQTVNGPLWTMPVEFMSYIALAVVFVVASYVTKRFTQKKGVYGLLNIISFLILLALSILIIITNDGGFLLTVVRPVTIFFEGVLFYHYREHIRLNWVIAIAFIVFMFVCTPVFNMSMIILFPYAIVAISLGTPQLSRLPKIVLSSYEMYLVGWPIQQVIVQRFGGDMSPFANFGISMIVDVLIGFLILEFVDFVGNKL